MPAPHSRAEEKLFPRQLERRSIGQRLEALGEHLEAPSGLTIAALRYLLDVDHEGYECVVLYVIVPDTEKTKRTAPRMAEVTQAIEIAATYADIAERIYVRFRWESEQKELDENQAFEVPRRIEAWTGQASQRVQTRIRTRKRGGART